MTPAPFTLPDYQLYVFSLQEHFSSVQVAEVIFKMHGRTVATLLADLFFARDVRLHIRESLDFDEAEPIQDYSYEVWRGEDRLYWYDSQPHPGDPDLASTHPHHKHIPPDIKHNRIPAPDLSFSRPNLPFLIREIEETLLGTTLPQTDPSE